MEYLNMINVQLAIQNAALMAHAQGLGCFYTGYLLSASARSKAIVQLVGIPDHHKIYGGLAVGYPKYVFRNWIERKHLMINWI